MIIPSGAFSGTVVFGELELQIWPGRQSPPQGAHTSRLNKSFISTLHSRDTVPRFRRRLKTRIGKECSAPVMLSYCKQPWVTKRTFRAKTELPLKSEVFRYNQFSGFYFFKAIMYQSKAHTQRGVGSFYTTGLSYTVKTLWYYNRRNIQSSTVIKAVNYSTSAIRYYSVLRGARAARCSCWAKTWRPELQPGRVHLLPPLPAHSFLTSAEKGQSVSCRISIFWNAISVPAFERENKKNK